MLKEINIMETLKKEVLKEKEFILIVMEMFMKVILKTEKEMVKENIPLVMVMFMMENLKMMLLKDVEY